LPSSKSTAGVISPLVAPDWLNWSSDTDDTLGLAYSKGGQHVFGWDRLENFLMTRDRLIGNKVTNTKCH